MRSNHNNLLAWGQAFTQLEIVTPSWIPYLRKSRPSHLDGFQTVQRMLSQKRLDVIQFRIGFDNKWLLSEVGMAIAQSKVSLN